MDINKIEEFFDDIAEKASEEVDVSDLQTYYADVKFEGWLVNPIGAVEQLEYLCDGDELKEDNEELIEQIKLLSEMRPKNVISNLMLRAKVNYSEIPEYMEKERWEEDNGSIEIRFIIANESDNELHDKQLEWLQEITGVHAMFLKGNNYITLCN